MPSYIQYKLPLVSSNGLTLEIAINKNSRSYTQAATDTITLDHFKFLIDEGLEISQEVSDEEALILADEIAMKFQDRFSYSGVSNGSPVSEDLEPTKSSLFEKIFDDPEALYTVFVHQKMEDGSWQLAFIGDTRYDGISSEHSGTIYPHTGDAQRLRSISVSFTLPQERLRIATVQDLLDSLVSADLGNSGVKLPFYGGFISHRTRISDYNYGPEIDSNLSLASNVIEVAAYDRTSGAGSGIYGVGMLGISLTNLVTAICDVADIEFSVADVDNSFSVYNQYWNSTNDAYDAETTASADVFDDTYLSLNYLFGISPIGTGEAFTSPVTFPRDQDLVSVLSAIAIQFGMVLTWSYNNTTKKPKLIFVARSANTGSLPSGWLLASSQEAERPVAKTHIKLKVRGDSGELICGDREGDGWDIEVPWRVRKWGGSTTVLGSELTHDPANGMAPEYQLWYHLNVAKTELNPNGWLGGSYLYKLSATTTAHYYPNLWTPSGGGDWAGYYACTGFNYGDSATHPDFIHPYAGLARYYYHHLLGKRIVLEREYIGVLANDGTISGVRPLFTIEEFIHGETRTFRAVKVNRSLRENRTSVTYMEVLDVTAWEDLPVYVGGEAGQSTGGVSSSNTNSNTPSYRGDYLVTHPSATLDNTTTAQTATTTPLTLIGHASQSEELLDVQTSARQVFRVSSGGNVELLPTGTSAGDTNELRLYELAANGTNYTGFKAPDTLAGNLVYVLPATATDGYVLQYDSTGNVLAWVDPTTLVSSGSLYFDDPGTSPATNPSATGTHAVAIGNASVSAGTKSVSIGTTYASGTESISFAGSDSTTTYGAQGTNTIAGGLKAKAVGAQSAVIGGDTSTTNQQLSGLFASQLSTTSVSGANANSGAAGGWGHSITGHRTFVTGGTSITVASTADSSFASGGNTNNISGKLAGTLGGLGLQVNGWEQVALGQYNVIEPSSVAGSFTAADPLFIIGVGTAPGTSSRATGLKFLGNGNLIVGGQVTGGAAGVTGSLTLKLTGETVGPTFVPLTHTAARNISIADYSANTHLVHAPAGTNGDYLQWTSGKPTWASSTLSLTGAIIIDPATDARNVIQPTASTVIGLTVKGAVSQSDSLQEWQLSSGAVVTKITGAGNIYTEDFATIATLFSGGPTGANGIENAGYAVFEGGASSAPQVTVIANASQSNDIFRVESNGGSELFIVDQNGNTEVGRDFGTWGRTRFIGIGQPSMAGAGPFTSFDVGAFTQIEVNPPGVRTINSLLANGTGQHIDFLNVSANTITFVHQDGASPAADRILCPGAINYALGPNQWCSFRYSFALNNWILRAY